MFDVDQSTEQSMVGDDYEESDNNMQQSNDNIPGITYKNLMI